MELCTKMQPNKQMKSQPKCKWPFILAWNMVPRLHIDSIKFVVQQGLKHLHICKWMSLYTFKNIPISLSWVIIAVLAEAVVVVMQEAWKVFYTWLLCRNASNDIYTSTDDVCGLEKGFTLASDGMTLANTLHLWVYSYVWNQKSKLMSLTTHAEYGHIQS